MEIIENMNERVKKFSFFDVKLIQGMVISAALVIVKLIPQILDISVWWFVALFVICALKPCYVFYIKK